MSKTRISAVVATHNGEAFLGAQLDSLAGQTLPPCEILISDDASTDGTDSVIEAFREVSPVPVVTWKNVPAKGYADNFLSAAARTQGEWIAFSDQDDIWAPNKLERCAEFFEDSTVTLVAHVADLIDSQDRSIGVLRQQIGQTSVRPPLSYDLWSTFLGFSMVFRADLLRLVPAERRFVDYIKPPRLVAHDRWICFLAQIAGRTVEIAEPLAQYRQHGNNLFGAHGSGNADSLLGRSKVYINATRSMIEIIQSLPDNTKDFPLLDKPAALRMCDKALSQLLTRHAVYVQPNRLHALGQVMQNVLAGTYAAAHDDSFRLRSLARDVAFLLTTR